MEVLVEVLMVLDVAVLMMESVVEMVEAIN